MEQDIEVGSIWVGKINEDVKVKVVQIYDGNIYYELLVETYLHAKGSLAKISKVSFKEVYSKKESQEDLAEYLKGFHAGVDATNEEYESGNAFTEDLKHEAWQGGYETGCRDTRGSRKADLESSFNEGYAVAMDELRGKRDNQYLLKEADNLIDDIEVSINNMFDAANEARKEKTTPYEFGFKEDEENEYEGIWSYNLVKDYEVEYFADCGTHVHMKVIRSPSKAFNRQVGEIVTISKPQLSVDYTKKALNKKTKEAMQDVVNKYNYKDTIWVANDGSGKIKVLSEKGDSCSVVLVEVINTEGHISVGDTIDIDKTDLENRWTKKSSLEDAVNNPKHYNSDPSGVKCIQITRHRNNNIGNVIKYLWRNGLKDGNSDIQDLEKAAWYLNDEIKRLKGEYDD